MDCRVRIEFDRSGIDGVTGELTGFIVPHILPYIPPIGQFSFDPTGLMKDKEQINLYQEMEERLGTTCVSSILVSFKDDVQTIILVLEFEKDYERTIRYEEQDRQNILMGKR